MRNIFSPLLLALLLAFNTGAALAADDNPAGEPEVTITQQGDKTIEEYRINGFLYAVKVIPKKGKPYFLVRADGDEGFIHSGKPELRIPSWEIYSW